MTCHLHLLIQQRLIQFLIALARKLKANTTVSSPFPMFSSLALLKSFLFIRGGLLIDDELGGPGKGDDKNSL